MKDFRNECFNYVMHFLWLQSKTYNFESFKMKYEISNNNQLKIYGTVKWEEEEIDDDDFVDFVWHVPENITYLRSTIKLINYVLYKDYTESDWFKISEIDLIKDLVLQGWDENEINGSIEFLFNTQIFMIDFGKESDSFYFHF